MHLTQADLPASIPAPATDTNIQGELTLAAIA